MEARATLLQGAQPRIAVEFTGIHGAEQAEAAAMVAELVVGGRWRNSIKRWVYPATVEKCREMRAAWGGYLRIHHDLSLWYRATARSQRSQTLAGTQADAELAVVPEVAPRLFAELAADQRAGAAWVANAYRGAGVFAPEMGVGKTRTVIAGLIERECTGNILVVCPKISVKAVWGKELARYAPHWPLYLARGTRKAREKALAEFVEDTSETKVLVIVAEMLRIKAKLKNGRITSDEEGNTTFAGFEYPELFQRPWDAIVVDESQKLLASTTIVKGTLAGFGLKKLPQTATPTSLRLAVTATPYGDGGEVHGMFGSLHWCWPTEYSSFWNFAEENFTVTTQKVSRSKEVKRIGALRMEGGVEAFYKTLGPRVFRRTLEEVSPEHVGKIKYWVQDCEMEPAQAAQYKELSDNAELHTSGGMLIANGPLAELTRARQVANGEVVVTQVKVNRWVPVLDEDGKETDEEELREFIEDQVVFTGVSGKLEALMANLDELGIIGGRGRRKVVVASQFNEFLWVIAERLNREGVKYHLLTGRTTDKQRDVMMEAFQAKGGPRVFLMNGKAGGVSVTLDAADWMLQMDEMYPPEANEQLHRRIFRRSRVHKAHIVYFRSEGTIDENVADNVGVKLHQQLKAMDGRRGRSIVREVIRYKEEK